MPDFDFTAPDGRTYTVTGPAGATPEQAFAILQSQMSSGQAKPSQPPSGSGIPRTAQEQARYDQWSAEMRAQGPDKPATFADKALGAGEAALSTLTGLTGGTVGMLAGGAAGIVGNLTNGRYGIRGGFEKGAQQGAESLTYAPRTEMGREYAGAIGEAVQDSGIAGLPIGPELMAAGNLAGSASRQAARAVGNSTEAYIAQKLAQKAAGAKLTPKIDQERALLAQKAADIGIEAPLHTLSDNKYVRMAGEFFDNLPLSGSTKRDNEVAFNRSLIGQIGGNPKKFEKLTPAVFGEALAKSGREIGEVFSKISVPFADEALQSDLQALRATLPRVLSDTERVIVGNMDELARLAEGNGGVIPGKSFKALHSDVLAKLREPAVDNHIGMREKLIDFKQLLEDAADRQITSPQDKQKYQIARTQHAKAIAIEPLVARGGINGVSPQALLQQLNSTRAGKHRMAIGAAGELGDLAQIAQNFMKETPTSNTAERSAVINAFGGVADLARAGAGITAGNIYNRIARPLARSTIRNSIDELPPPVRFNDELGFAMEPVWPARQAAQAPEYSGLLTADQAEFGGPRLATSEALATRQDIPSMDLPQPSPTSGRPSYPQGIDYANEPLPVLRSGERLPVERDPFSIEYDGGVRYYENQAPPAAQQIPESQGMRFQTQAPESGPNPFPQPLAGQIAEGLALETPEQSAMRATTQQSGAINYDQIPVTARVETLQSPENIAWINQARNEAARLQQIIDNAISPNVRMKAQSNLLRLQDEFGARMREIGIRGREDATGATRMFDQSPRQIQKTYDARQQVNAERQRLKLQAIGDAKTVDEAIRAASE